MELICHQVLVLVQLMQANQKLVNMFNCTSKAKDNKHILANIQRMQVYNLIICGHLCIVIIIIIIIISLCSYYFTDMIKQLEFLLHKVFILHKVKFGYTQIKFETQYFSERFPKKNYFDIFFLLQRSYKGIFVCFEILIRSA